MSWSIGFDSNWNRDIGYGVPCICDHPGCNKEINRGLSYVCGGEPYGGEEGCGLYFCSEHLVFSDNHERCVCRACANGAIPYDPKPDTQEWLRWKLRDESWQQWREENPDEVQRIRDLLRRYAA